MVDNNRVVVHGTHVFIDVSPENIEGKVASGPVEITHTLNFASIAKLVGPDEGRACWTALHQCETPSEEWLAVWEETIPKYNCGGGCRKFYTSWKDNNPPRFEDFFAWSVELHNAVNVKLGKPTVELDESEKIWNKR